MADLQGMVSCLRVTQLQTSGNTTFVIRGFGNELNRPGFEQIDSPHKRLIGIEGSGDRSNHVLAGDIMAPENNDLIADYLREFFLANQQPETNQR